PALREAAGRLGGLAFLVLRRDAEREAVFGPERAAALHRQRMRDRGARSEAELHDDLAQRAIRLLLDLEHGRELLLADQPELGHQLTELTLRHALALGGGAQAGVLTRRREITMFRSAEGAATLNSAACEAGTLVRGMAGRAVSDDDCARTPAASGTSY